MRPIECPFCGGDLIYRTSDKQWIHPGTGCVMVGIGLHSDRLVYLWNTRGGVPPAGAKPPHPVPAPAPAGTKPPRPSPASGSRIQTPPPPPPPPVPANQCLKWVNLNFTVDGGSERIVWQGVIDLSSNQRE